MVLPGLPHHVTARGNYRQQVFFGEDDYQLYLDLLGRPLPRHRLRLDGYCLMPNHVHLIVTPEPQGKLGAAMQKLIRFRPRAAFASSPIGPFVAGPL